MSVPSWTTLKAAMNRICTAYYAHEAAKDAEWACEDDRNMRRGYPFGSGGCEIEHSATCKAEDELHEAIGNADKLLGR